MKTTFVIPLSSRARDRRDIERFKRILWPSIKRHVLAHDVLQEVIVICRGIDRTKIDLSEKDNLFVRVVTDEQILGPLDLIYTNPWVKQQALKLLIHERVETDTYLLLDGDCFAAKPLRERDLFPEGKARLGLGDGSHEEWWPPSALLLKQGDMGPPAHPYMGVTPQILYTRIVAGLLKELEDMYQQDPRELLGRHQFTEYTLYWRYLLEVAKPEDLYFMNEDRLHLSRGVWTNSTEPLGDLRRLLDYGRTCFGLVQSLLGIDPELVAEILEGKSHGASKDQQR